MFYRSSVVSPLFFAPTLPLSRLLGGARADHSSTVVQLVCNGNYACTCTGTTVLSYSHYLSVFFFALGMKRNQGNTNNWYQIKTVDSINLINQETQTIASSNNKHCGIHNSVYSVGFFNLLSSQ